MVKQDMRYDESVRVFLRYCRAKGLRETTNGIYRFALDELGKSLRATEENPPIPDRDDLRRFITEMLDRELALSTIAIRMRSVKAFANFLERDGITDTSPMEGVHIPRVPTRYPQPLSSEETSKLIRAARTGTWFGIRNSAMLSLFCDTGIRLGELVGLDIDDVRLSEFEIRIRKGKGRGERSVYMGRTLYRALRKWSQVRPTAGLTEAYLCTRDGRRLDKRNVARIVERAGKSAGLEKRKTHPTMLRHTYATLFIKNGGNSFSLQRILGHSSIKTTMIYVNLAGSDLRDAHAKASPLDRL